MYSGLVFFSMNNSEKNLSKCWSFPFRSHTSVEADLIVQTNPITAVDPKTITCTLLLMKTVFDTERPS
jgi:hypothetical protein